MTNKTILEAQAEALETVWRKYGNAWPTAFSHVKQAAEELRVQAAAEQRTKSETGQRECKRFGAEVLEALEATLKGWPDRTEWISGQRNKYLHRSEVIGEIHYRADRLRRDAAKLAAEQPTKEAEQPVEEQAPRAGERILRAHGGA